MEKRKIAECINIRINVGNYQHIELTKYAEEEIEFDSASDRENKENQLRDDLLASMMRSMKAIPARLGKGIDQAVEVEEAIQKAIPEWLEKGTVPNIANGAKEKLIQAAAEQKNNKDSQIDVPEEKNSIIDKYKNVGQQVPPPEVLATLSQPTAADPKLSDEDVKDLFEDDTPAVAKESSETSKTVETKSEVPTKSAKEDLKEFFDDDDEDLFSEV